MTDLITLPATDLAVALDKAQTLEEQAIAPNTKRAYAADWRDFTRWCEAHSVRPLPADVATVRGYLAECAERFKLATIERHLTSISKAHSTSGMPNPTKTEAIHFIMKGIRRQLGTAQTQKAPVITDVLRAMLDTLGSGLSASRDRAILLLGFAGVFRRSELVALDITDLRFTSAGVVVTMRRSKTDQEGAGVTKGIPMGLFPVTCPVRALRAWIEAAELVSGGDFPAHRSPWQYQSPAFDSTCNRADRQARRWRGWARC